MKIKVTFETETGTNCVLSFLDDGTISLTGFSASAPSTSCIVRGPEAVKLAHAALDLAASCAIVDSLCERA